MTPMTFQSPSLPATPATDTPTLAPTKTFVPETYGKDEEGTWMVHVPGPNPHGISWGPFPNRTEAVEFMTLVNPERMFAVNMTELPNFFN